MLPSRDPQYRKKWRHDHRKKAVEFLGGKCKRCGFSDYRALQIDHVNGDGKAEWKKYHSSTSNGLWTRIKEHPERYQLLCANCNWIKRVENGEEN